MNREVSLLSGIGLGAGLMYLFDPQMGRRRRVLLRDQAISLCNDAEDVLRVLGRDLRHRSSGLLAEARSCFRGEEVSDRVLAERVRAKMGRVIGHPGALDVQATNGRVTLRGPILAHEVNRLLSAVSSVRGVKGVDNQLEVHQEAGRLSALQGGRERPGERPELLQRTMSPTARLVVGAAGTGLLAYGAACRAPAACLLGTLGLGLLARSALNAGRGSGRGRSGEQPQGRRHAEAAGGQQQRQPQGQEAMPRAAGR